MKNTKINWMKVSKKFHTNNKKKIQTIIDNMEWKEIKTEGQNVAFCIGDGINRYIQEFKIPKVKQFASSNAIAPYGLYGITSEYKNAYVKHFIIDTGVCITPLCQYVIEK